MFENSGSGFDFACFCFCFEYCSVILTFSAARAWIFGHFCVIFIVVFIYRRRDRSDERPLLNAELMALQALNITVMNLFKILGNY